METAGETAVRFLTASQVRVRYGSISEMTLWRWLNSETMGFPQPMVINRRRLWNESDLIRFDRAQVAA